MKFNVTLTEQEVRIYMQWLKKNRMYKGMKLPLGNPWESWMQDTIDKLQHTLNDSISDLDSLGRHYRGKVRDNYYLDNQILMVTSDRVSAFDHVLGTIPFKGQILSDIASFWFHKTQDIVPNHYIKSVDPQVLLVKEAKPLPVEIAVTSTN